jgi:hypothetical protein
VAVQVAPTVKPVIVVMNGVAVDAEPDAGVGVPLVQVTLTETDAPLLGENVLLTVSVALFNVFVIVQEWTPLTAIATLAQLVWFAV